MIKKIKSVLTILLALPALLLCSCQSDGEKLLESQQELATLLETVKDKDSADAAADDVASLLITIKELGEKEGVAKSLNEDQKAKYTEAYKKSGREILRIVFQSCFGSEKLKDAMDKKKK